MKRSADRDPEQRYSNSNPPQSKEEAVRRLDEVINTIDRIEADIQSKNQDRFGSLDAFDFWRVRAMRALKHSRSEKCFLLKWIDPSKKFNPESLASDPKKLMALEKFVSEFLQNPYQCLFSDASVISTVEEMQKRKKDLMQTLQEHESLLGQIKAEAIKLGCSPQDLNTVRKKVLTTLNAIRTEHNVLKDMWRTRNRNAMSESTIERPHTGNQTQPSNNPSLAGIHAELRKIKNALNMLPSDMTEWMLNLIMSQKDKLTMTEEHERILLSIKKYVELSAASRSIQFLFGTT
jgi:hypothetical protein